MTTAQNIAVAIKTANRWPICCPYNVAQVARGSFWCAILPDKSILFCDYDEKRLVCGTRGETEDWTAIYNMVNDQTSTEECAR